MAYFSPPLRGESDRGGGMYRLLLKELVFKTIIGIEPWEREIKQPIVVNCSIDYPSKGEYIDYGEVARTIKILITEGQFHLLEEALDALEAVLVEKYPQMKRLYIQICKPNVLKDALPCVEILRFF
jgi:dihydroneopterin aldolase